MKSNWQDIKNSAREFKVTVERDLVIRRYQMWMQGETTLGEKIGDVVARLRAYLLISWRHGIKRFLDLSISLIGTLIASPVMFIVAVAIKLDSKGPVLYKQVRVGQGGVLFNIYKFRTMRQDAEVASGPVWATENDPRVTRLGRFLRTSHLDELPQFFNVIKGEMSLVGPRPERPHFVNEFRLTIPRYDLRLCAKPGVTGLAQVKRRYDANLADVKKKLRYDVLYIENMCPIMDLKVMLLTFGTMIFRTGR